MIWAAAVNVTMGEVGFPREKEAQENYKMEAFLDA